jgi:hypothetical protein
MLCCVLCVVCCYTLFPAYSLPGGVSTTLLNQAFGGIRVYGKVEEAPQKSRLHHQWGFCEWFSGDETEPLPIGWLSKGPWLAP